MTDRLVGFIVTLESDMRDDDAESTISAIRHVRGVLSVKPVVADIETHFAYERAKRDLGDKIWAVLYPKT